MAKTLYRQLCNILQDSECKFIRQGKGSHEIWHSPINDKHFSVPFTVKSKATSNAILKQAGINKKI